MEIHGDRVSVRRAVSAEPYLVHAFIGVVRPMAEDNAPIATVKYDVERDCSLIQEGQKHGDTHPISGLSEKRARAGHTGEGHAPDLYVKIAPVVRAAVGRACVLLCCVCCVRSCVS